MRPNVFAVIFAAIAFTVGGVLPVSATPLTWNINVSLEDGTSATGSFVFDAATTNFSNLSLTTSGGTIVPSINTWVFNTVSPLGEQNAGIFTGFQAVDSAGTNLVGAHAIDLFGVGIGLMTDAAGTLNLNHLDGGTCKTADCAFIDFQFPIAFSGTGTFTANAVTDVPEPLTASIFGLGIAGMIAVRRKSAPLSAIAALSNRGKIYGV